MSAALFRGEHRLHGVSREDVDWDALTIARHLGGLTIGARYTIGGRDRFTVFAPDSPHRWQEFASRAALDAWLDAYGCTATEETPGRPHLFTVRFPASLDDMQPLHARTVEEVNAR